MRSKAWCFLFGALLCGQLAWGVDRVKLESVGSVDFAGQVIDVSVCLVGQYACVAGFWDDGRWRGLKVVDFSQPANPTVVGECETSTTLHRVASAGQYVFGISGDGQMDVIDVHNPAEPILVKTLQVDVTNVEDLEVFDSYVLVSGATSHTPIEWTGSVHMFDVRIPESPFEVGAFELGDTAWWPMDYADGFAYFVTPSSEGDEFEFQVIDLNKPSAPSRAWQGRFLGPTPHPTTVTVSEGFAYVGFGAMWCDGGVVILDITDPSHITHIGRYTPTPARCVHEISVLGNYAYLAMCSVDEIIDVSETPASWLVGCYDKCDFGYTTAGVVLTDTYAHIVDGNGYHLLSITELPAITRQYIMGNTLSLRWNEPARGMKLQRSTSLTNPDWQDMQGSEEMTAVEMPLWGGREYFRLAGASPVQDGKPYINSTVFGSITIEETVYSHDVVVAFDGTVGDRRTLLTSLGLSNPHLVTLAEAELVFQQGALRVIIGSGQSGVLQVSDEAREFLESNGCTVEVLSTPAAIEAWNATQEPVVGIFHVNC